MYLSMTPAQAVRLFASYYPDPMPTADLLDLVGLDARRQRTAWRQLSGGEKQRLNLALALVGRPEVLLLDEPTAGLDPQGQQQLREMLAALRSDNMTMLIATHDLDDVESNVDQVCIINNGHVAYQGPTTEPQHNTSVVAQLAAPLDNESRERITHACASTGISPPMFLDASFTVSANDAVDAQRVLGVVSQLLAQQGLAARQLHLTGGRLADIYDRSVTS
jgi:ABC-2 type transport system ATP-binding protein